jgi:hypothetical protein
MSVASLDDAADPAEHLDMIDVIELCQARYTQVGLGRLARIT